MLSSVTASNTYSTRSEAAEAPALMTARKQLLTRNEAAATLSLSVRMIDELVKSGDLQTVRIGRAVRFRPSALEYFIEARESRMNPRKKGGR